MPHGTRRRRFWTSSRGEIKDSHIFDLFIDDSDIIDASILVFFEAQAVYIFTVITPGERYDGVTPSTGHGDSYEPIANESNSDDGDFNNYDDGPGRAHRRGSVAEASAVSKGHGWTEIPY